MGHHAVIGNSNRPAPRVKATNRITPAAQQEKSDRLAGPVTVSEFTYTPEHMALLLKGDPGASIDKHGSRGAISGKGLNGTGQTVLGVHLTDALKFRPIKTPGGSVTREELKIAAGIVVFRQVTISKVRVWVGELRSAGKVTREFIGVNSYGHVMSKSDARDALLNKIQTAGLSLY